MYNSSFTFIGLNLHQKADSKAQQHNKRWAIIHLHVDVGYSDMHLHADAGYSDV